MVNQVFDEIVEAYDWWYETPEGMAIFHAELKCLRSLYDKCPGLWLEIGVGTGRFSCSLGIAKGIDPSSRMLEVAARRGIKTYAGNAENIPFPEGSFDGVLMALTLCFVANSAKALEECQRVLRPGGCLLLGFVPADSPWGRDCIEKAAKGHPVYALAHFQMASEVVALAQHAGFALTDAASTLFWKPEEVSPSVPQIEQGICSGAGFLGLLFHKTVPRTGNDRELFWAA